MELLEQHGQFKRIVKYFSKRWGEEADFGLKVPHLLKGQFTSTKFIHCLLCIMSVKQWMKFLNQQNIFGIPEVNQVAATSSKENKMPPY